MSSGVRPGETVAADQRPQGSPVSAEEAEKAAAEAQARAVAARARAAQLRRQAEAADDRSETPADDGRAEPPAWQPARSRRRLLRRPGARALSVSTSVLITGIALAASGYLLWQDRTGVQNRQRAEEFAAAARRDAVILMSVEAGKVQEDVQRMLDNSTGAFKDYLDGNANGLVAELKNAEVSTKVTVQAAAVESMTDDSAVVLVAAKSDISGADDAEQEPRTWRLSLTLTRDGGQLKMSKVEFL